MFDSVCFLITSICNLSCPYCYRLPSNKDFIEIHKYEKCLLALKKIGTKIINITGGEPLLHPNWKQYVKMAKNMGFVVNLTSNTLLLDINNEALSQLNLLTISCDGIENGMYRNRHEQQFKKSLHVIQEFNKKAFPFRLKVNTVVTQTNISTLEQFAQDFLDNPSIIWMLFPYTRRGPYNNMPKELETSVSEMQRLLLRLKDSDFKCRIMIEHSTNLLLQKNAYFLINADSNLYFCTADADYLLCNLVDEPYHHAMEQACHLGIEFEFQDYTGEI